MKAKVWMNENSQWFWHFESKGRITADSEAFPSKANALRACKAVISAIFKSTSFQGTDTITRLDVQFEVTKEVDGVVWVRWYL